MEDLCKELLPHLVPSSGLDDEALENTPRRWAEGLLELTRGYLVNVPDVLKRQFEEDNKEMVLVKDIRYYSLCKHHILPFTGTIAIAYIPDGQVVGLSKLHRLVYAYSRRLQMQETLVKEIAEALVTYVHVHGAMVVATGVHTCCSARGAESSGVMITSAIRGAFEEPSVKSEALRLMGLGNA